MLGRVSKHFNDYHNPILLNLCVVSIPVLCSNHILMFSNYEFKSKGKKLIKNCKKAYSFRSIKNIANFLLKFQGY